MQTSIATLTIEGIANMTHSHRHSAPRLEKEGDEAYENRTWRLKLNTMLLNGRPTICLPAHGMHQCLVDGAKYSKLKIPGSARSTWTGKFASGIMLMGNCPLNPPHNDPNVVDYIEIFAHSNGVRGSGRRVVRRFPVIPVGWTATFNVHILDPVITRNIFEEIVPYSGIFVGMGQFRPANTGSNGRFVLTNLDWQDNREFVYKQSISEAA
jgi:hypothetical protein